ncbi:MAG TPA: glycosyltransferase family 4 protein, partial [Pyrinomonadaceae bacterium]|nr:glycosyltransferase family 4 protein [Pyrinomonadaceae bacterium]
GARRASPETVRGATTFDDGAARLDAASSSAPGRLRVALVDWSQLLEDYLDNIGVSFESFRGEMSGGWMFGYVDAMRRAGVSVTLFCVSARVRETSHFTHAPTGAPLCVLPAPRAYRSLRRSIPNPYAATVEEAAGDVRGARRLWLAALKDLSSYLSTPALRLARELRRGRFDAVLCQDYEHGRFDVCSAAARAAGCSVFATFQGGDRSSGWLERAVRGFMLRQTDGLVVAPAAEAARVASRYRLPSSNVARVFNPLDLSEWDADDKQEARRFVGLPSGATVVAWHGRVDFRRKGLDVLLDAWARVSRGRPQRDLRLLLVGTGNDARELRECVERERPAGLLWMDSYVRSRALLRRYLSAADIYAFPSRHEGFAVAPLEAMACGLPLVAADAPGVPDILEGGEASGGLLVPRGDVSSFADALGRLIDDAELRQRLGERARARVREKFSPEAAGAQLRDFLLRGKHERPAADATPTAEALKGTGQG